MSRLSESARYAAKMKVLEWISQGLSRQTIRILIDEKFGLTSLTAQNKLINEAYSEMGDKIDLGAIKLLLIERLEAIGIKAEEADKFNDAIKSIDTQARILGLTNNSKEIKVDKDSNSFTIKFD